MEPAALIVSGSWHLPFHYERLIEALGKAGFVTARCPKLHTAVETLPVPAEATLAGDTALIRDEVTALSDAGFVITIICHSYGGVLTNNSVTKDLLLSTRKAQGKSGGVVHIVYMAAFTIPPGTALVDTFMGNPPPWIEPDELKRLLYHTEPREAFYHDVDDATADEMVSKLCYCSLHCLRDTMERAPYQEIGKGLDVTYLVCKEDARLFVPIQEALATNLGEERKMEYVDAGHCAMVSKPDDVAAVAWRAWESSKAKL